VLIGIERKVENMETDITEIKISVATVSGDVKHIIEKLNNLCCQSHSIKLQEIELKQERFEGNVFKTILATALSIIMFIGASIGAAVNLGWLK